MLFGGFFLFLYREGGRCYPPNPGSTKNAPPSLFMSEETTVPRCKIRRENRRAFPIDFRGPKIPCTCHFNHRNLSGSIGFRIGQNIANWGLILMMLSFLLKIE